VDNLTPEQRSYMMSRVRSTDTTPELLVRKLVHARGLRFRKHCTWLPGRPDLLFAQSRTVVFVEGDYWHGWRFAAWMEKLTPYWKHKIEGNRRRDARNLRKLRREGWVVIRIWEHDVKRDVERCIDRIEAAVRRRAGTSPNRRISGTGKCEEHESKRPPMRSQGRASPCTPSHTGGPSDALDDSEPATGGQG
jgi:DNA mismatch endonuclease (patch repair protein)